MAINYGAGFLPQGLYDNIANMRQAGFDQNQRNRRQRDQALGSALGKFGKANIEQGEEAKRQLKEQYETQKTQLDSVINRLDPRSYDARKFINQRKALDQKYASAISQFEDTGFLRMGRDRDQLNIGELGDLAYDPTSTREAFSLADDETKQRTAALVAREQIAPDAEEKARAARAVAQNPDQILFEEAEYQKAFKRSKNEDAERLKNDLTKIDRQNQGNKDIARMNNATRKEIAEGGRADEKELMGLRMEMMKEESKARLTEIAQRMKLAAEKGGAKAITAGDMASLLTASTNAAYAALGIDKASGQFDPRVKGAINDYMMQTLSFTGLKTGDVEKIMKQGGGGGGGGLDPSEIFEARKTGGENAPPTAQAAPEPPKPAQFPKQERINAQLEDMVDRTDSTLGLGGASPEVQKEAADIAREVRYLMNQYNQLPDGNSAKKEFEQRIAQLMTRANQISKENRSIGEIAGSFLSPARVMSSAQ